MKVAILETVKAKAGFELEFDRIIIEALQEAGHEPVMMLPEKTVLDQDFPIPTYSLAGGEIVSYDGVKGVKKIWYSYLREKRRVKWFNAAISVIQKERIDAVLLTTATYRYLRSLKKSCLRYSPVPIYFMFLGVNPQEKPKFLKLARDCMKFNNIHLCVITLRDDFRSELPQNARLIPPPVMIPANCMLQEEHAPLRIGFFGHYRKGEKNIDWLLNCAKEAKFNREVKFVIQLVPTTAADQQEVDHIVTDWCGDERVEFITEKLLKDDWYNAIQGVDVVYLPYTAPRYLYNWSAIYFTAIGANKPVITTRVLNPEIMQQYRVGEYIDVDNFPVFKSQLEKFVNKYEKNKAIYKRELTKANSIYSKAEFIRKLLL